MHLLAPFDDMSLLAVIVVTIRVSIADPLNACSSATGVDRSGPDIIDIPRNLNKNITYLTISETNISVLNLTALVDYSAMCRLNIRFSPVSTIITPNPPHTVALTTFYLVRSGNFLTPPDLGIVLSTQLKYLSFNSIGITTVPENYFQNYSDLRSLYLAGNPITNINAGNLEGLRQLTYLNLGDTKVNPVPPLGLWLPNLRSLYIPRVDITLLPGTLLENLPHLENLNLIGNQLSRIPTKEYFINLQNMKVVYLSGNPLRCDSRLLWVKVNVLKCIYRKWCMICVCIIIYTMKLMCGYLCCCTSLSYSRDCTNYLF